MSNKIGILSDIHGNYDALEAVIKSAKKKRINNFIFCGDLVGYYYEPRKCIDLLSEFKVDYIKGNHEIMLADYINKKINKEEVISKYGNGLFKAIEQLSTKQIDFLLSLDHSKTIKLNNKLLKISHGSPWSPFDYIYSNSSDEKFLKFNSCKEDIFILGNTHHQMNIKKYSKVIFNPGSVGQPRDIKGKASWATLDKKSFKVDFFCEEYDKSKLLKQVKEIEKENHYNYRALIEKKK